MASLNVSASPLYLSLDRQENVIQLRCSNASGQSLSTSAIFYLNNMVLNAGNFDGFVATVMRQDMVIFRIDPKLEGNYSCGVGNQRSNATLLIGKHLVYR